MTEEEFRREVAGLEERLRQGLPLDKSAQLRLLAAYLLRAETRREQKYGLP
jgi:hypothetical protein